jgi:flagellar biosynthesis/type III secretory pathway M-ring protein FliF/YscJ
VQRLHYERAKNTDDGTSDLDNLPKKDSLIMAIVAVCALFAVLLVLMIVCMRYIRKRKQDIEQK